jgi:molecular chaperone Hsp33
LSPAELLAFDPQALLTNLFGAHDLRLFAGEPVRFACRCNRERVAAMLRGLGQEEVQSILAEQGAVTVTCEFCRKPYRFDSVDATGLFMPTGAADSQRLN